MSGNLLPNENDSAEQRQAKLDMQVTVIEALFDAAKNDNEAAARLWLRARLMSEVELLVGPLHDGGICGPISKMDEVTREEDQRGGFRAVMHPNEQFFDNPDRTFDKEAFKEWKKGLDPITGGHKA